MSFPRPYVAGLARTHAVPLAARQPSRAIASSTDTRSLPRPPRRASRQPSRSFGTASSVLHPAAAYPTTPHCPAPTCPCAATPELDIERDARLAGTAPAYDQHVVISTGRSDWRSRIESEGMLAGETAGPKERVGRWFAGAKHGAEPGLREVGLARGLKRLLGRDGEYFDPQQTVSVTNSSFGPRAAAAAAADETAAGPSPVSALLFPSFRRVDGIPDSLEGHRAFARDFIRQAPAAETGPRPARSPSTAAPIRGATVLVCSHGARDARCGVLGPLLHAEFKRQLERAGVRDDGSPESTAATAPAASVGMVSHIGGHKWAGNVIVYVPPGWPTWAGSGAGAGRGGLAAGSGSALGGRGVWYGRVEPRHVEGIVRDTVLGGRVVGELCRGVVW